MSQNDEELIMLVVNSEEFKKAEGIVDVRRAVRRVLRKRLIDLHIDDSTSISAREAIVNKHLEWITLRILRELDGIMIIPEHYEDLEKLHLSWDGQTLGRSRRLDECIAAIGSVETQWL